MNDLLKTTAAAECNKKIDFESIKQWATVEEALAPCDDLPKTTAAAECNRKIDFESIKQWATVEALIEKAFAPYEVRSGK